MPWYELKWGNQFMIEINRAKTEPLDRCERETYSAMFAVWSGILAGELSFDPFSVNRQMCHFRNIAPEHGVDMSWAAYHDALEIKELSGYVGKHALATNEL